MKESENTIEEENKKLKEAITKITSISGIRSRSYWVGRLGYAIKNGSIENFLKEIEPAVKRSDAIFKAKEEKDSLFKGIYDKGFKRINNKEAIIYCLWPDDGVSPTGSGAAKTTRTGIAYMNSNYFVVIINKSDLKLFKILPSQIYGRVKRRVGPRRMTSLSGRLLDYLSIDEIRDTIYKAFPDRKEEIKTILVTKLAKGER